CPQPIAHARLLPLPFLLMLAFVVLPHGSYAQQAPPLGSGPEAHEGTTPLEAYFNVASPLELTAAKRADRVAWTVYEAGMRNVYTATAPDFSPERLTSFLNDDGQEVSSVRLSDDGSVAVFVRGHAPNRDGWVANPMHDPAGS